MMLFFRHISQHIVPAWSQKRKNHSFWHEKKGIFSPKPPP